MTSSEQVSAPFWTFRMAIGQVTAILVALTGLGVATVAYVTGTATVTDLSGHIYEHDASYAATLAEEYASSARLTINLTRASVARGTLSTDFDSLGPHFIDVLRNSPRLSIAGFGEASGQALWAERSADGSLLLRRYEGHPEGRARHRAWTVDPSSDTWTLIVDEPTDFDASARPWFLTGAAADEPVWTEPYLFLPDNVPGITLAAPAVGPDGNSIGVLTTDYQLSFLSHALSRLDRGDGAQGLIFDDQGYVLGHSDPDATRIVEQDGTTTMAQIEGHPNALVGLVASLSPAERTATDGALRMVRYGGERYAVAVHPTASELDLGWHVAVIVRESSLLASVYSSTLYSLIIGGLGVLLAVLTALFFTRWLTRSFYGFYEEMRRVGELDLAPRPLPLTLIREIHHLSQHLAQMKTSLRSFERYVPASLVRDLTARGIEAVPGGEIREITVLFTDVEGFTTISEQYPPQELAERLGDHLSVLSTVIQGHDGTVDKYIGDAIMAFWNAPGEQPRHAELACAAGLDMLQAIRDSTAKSPPLWPIRVGMATTNAVVGNLGSPTRLDYTAIGDGVNLASRLEGLNKQYGTRILLSEETATRVRAIFPVRPVDQVVVKGQTRQVTVFEALGSAFDDVINQRIEISQQAFDHLMADRPDQALPLYRRLLELQVDDPVALTMILRITG
ncbi:MAG: adenylate cyclase [Kiritimatiellia bacterium]